MQETDLAEDQNCVTGARAWQESGDQDVSVKADRYRVSLLGPGHPDPSGTAFAPGEAAPSRRQAARSEEHTSELQSLAYLVCRLLLEKKKKYHRQNPTTAPTRS